MLHARPEAPLYVDEHRVLIAEWITRIKKVLQ
jgi:hypothetical protein